MNYIYMFLSGMLLLMTTSCKSGSHSVDSLPDHSSSMVQAPSLTTYPKENVRVISDLVKIWPADPVLVPSPVTIASRLDSLFCDSLLQYAQAALYVYDITADSALYERGIHQRMRPASTQKILTAVTALGLLGPGYTYQSKLYLHGKQQGQTWQGAVCVKGGFDPLFSKADLQRFVSAIRSRNIRVINGPLLLDVSFKDTLEAGNGWCWDDENPSLSPLLVNGKDCFAQAFRQELSRQGIRIVGGDSIGMVPQHANCITTARHGIAAVLRPMMKESDNQMAESLFYQLAARKGKAWATAEDASKIVTNYIAKHIGGDVSMYRVADGCGLSPYNFVTVELLVNLLRYADAQPQIREQFLASLPVAGVDGTMKKRMLGTAAQGNVCAKTGTLTGTSSLAGYATAANGHRLCFAIIVQGQRKGTEARKFQDKVCRILTERP